MMLIEPGQMLLHYRILDKIGEGGMGVVWRAVDSTLDRQVAIKVLPESLAADPDRLSRFEREAKLLASLNHPNIAEIYGLHTQGEARFIAMELIEGEDLSQRLERGPLQKTEVLDLAKDIAGAFEAAHEQGVVHRDLKPANVMLAADGRVKVLDFGLAKAFQLDPASSDANPSISPTLTSAGTVAGMILGTAAYMAPEQARGHAVDKRADIWALGCVLYEALTGSRAFAGDTVSDTIAAVLKTDPNWDVLPADIDPSLRHLIARCLEKDVRKRLRDIGEVRIAVDRLLSGDVSEYGAIAGSVAADAAGPESLDRSWPLKSVVMSVVIASLAGTLGWWLRSSNGVEQSAVRRLDIVTPGIELGWTKTPVLSPDGRRVAYVSEGRIWTRDLTQFESQEVSGSDDATNLMWSPEGDDIAWLSHGKVWRASVTGGSKSAVCDAPKKVLWGAWGPADRIVLTPDVGPVYEVSARGGDPRAILAPIDGQDEDFHTASFLPDGRGLIFSTHRLGRDVSDTIEVLVDGQRKVVHQVEDHWVVMPQVSRDGYLVYRRAGGNDGLWAAPFSLEQLEVTGEPILVDPLGIFHSLSDDGSMLYFRRSGIPERQMVWVDREGRQTDAIGPPQVGLGWPAVSPDGRRVAVSADGGDVPNIWIHDTVRGSRTRLTFSADADWAPAWYADGQRVAFGRSFGPEAHIMAVAADGGDDPKEITAGELVNLSMDGRTLVFERYSQDTDDDLLFKSTTGDTEPSVFLSTPLSEEHSQISPDGEYVVYTSDESGRDEIYLKRFPDGSGKWQVSIDGGNWARWNPSGGELFFLNGMNLMAVDLDLGPTPRLGSPKVLFSLDRAGLISGLSRPYDVAPDGSRFVMLKSADTEIGDPALTFVEHWSRPLR